MKITVEHMDLPENEVILRCPALDEEMLGVLSLLRSGLQRLCVWDDSRRTTLLTPDEVMRLPADKLLVMVNHEQLLELEKYDYTPGSGSLIRATEGTVLERIPPRVRVRRDAPIELPHVMLLIDDPDRTVIEPLAAASGEMEKLYDFDLQ